MRVRLVCLLAALPMACGGPTVSSSTTSPTGPDSTTATSRPPAPTTTTTIPPPTQILVLHETAGYRHDSIPAGVAAIETIGAELGYEVIASEDSSVLVASDLNEVALIVFLNTTGDVLDREEEEAVEGYIRSGGGFVGIHSATDTEYDWVWYGGLVGAYFSDHPALQPATVHSTGSGHPAGAGLPDSFERFDEWYNLQGRPGPEVVVLATVDETSYEGGTMGPDHPISWAQEYDGGRSFYTAMGHTVESYSEPLFLDHLRVGLLWAAGEG